MNPQTVEAELERLTRILGEKGDEYAGLIRTAAEADVQFKREYARKFTTLAVGGSVRVSIAEKEQRVLNAVMDQYAAKKYAEAEVDACKQVMKALETQIGALQTLNANQRVLSR